MCLVVEQPHVAGKDSKQNFVLENKSCRLISTSELNKQRHLLQFVNINLNLYTPVKNNQRAKQTFFVRPGPTAAVEPLLRKSVLQWIWSISTFSARLDTSRDVCRGQIFRDEVPQLSFISNG